MIGWKLVKNASDLDVFELSEKIKPTEYPFWVFEHAFYDESEGFEILYLNDMERMIRDMRGE